MEICKSISPTFECSILVPINKGNIQSFSQKSRNYDTEKIKAFDFNVNETDIILKWIKGLENLFGYIIKTPGRLVIKPNMINKVSENAKSYFSTISLLFHKQIYQKLSEALTLAEETLQPIAIQTSLSQDFGYCITVPLNKKGFDQLEHCHENKAFQKEWYIHESQVQMLLEKFLFNVAVNYHIPYMDTYESPVIPSEDVSAILEEIKSIKTRTDIEEEAFSFLRNALELACKLNMPVYLFF